MDKKKYVLMTVAGLLSELGAGIVMTILGEATGLVYNELPVFAAIGLGLCLALGVVYSLVNRKVCRLHLNTPTYTFVVRVLPVTLSICCLIALPVMVLMQIISSSAEFVVLMELSVGTMLTAFFSSVITAIVNRVSRMKKSK